jgi:prefoldin subunit 5
MKHYLENALRDVNAAIRSIEAAQESLDEPNRQLSSCIYQLNDERQRLETLLQLVEAGEAGEARLRSVPS